jgi:hypothetical protein
MDIDEFFGVLDDVYYRIDIYNKKNINNEKRILKLLYIDLTNYHIKLINELLIQKSINKITNKITKKSFDDTYIDLIKNHIKLNNLLFKDKTSDCINIYHDKINKFFKYYKYVYESPSSLKSLSFKQIINSNININFLPNKFQLLININIFNNNNLIEIIDNELDKIFTYNLYTKYRKLDMLLNKIKIAKIDIISDKLKNKISHIENLLDCIYKEF